MGGGRRGSGVARPRRTTPSRVHLFRSHRDRPTWTTTTTTITHVFSRPSTISRIRARISRRCDRSGATASSLPPIDARARFTIVALWTFTGVVIAASLFAIQSRAWTRWSYRRDRSCDHSCRHSTSRTIPPFIAK